MALLHSDMVGVMDREPEEDPDCAWLLEAEAQAELPPELLLPGEEEAEAQKVTVGLLEELKEAEEEAHRD